MSTKQAAETFLENARLGPRNEVLLEFDERTQFPRLNRLFHSYTHVDLAHAVMMVETGVLRADRGAKLLKHLLEIHAMTPQSFPWLESSNSYLVHVEHHLGQTVGADIGGLLQTARSRNDQDAAAERLFQRDLILKLSKALLEFLDTVLDQAEMHANTLMPGYTHLQHAQPWTYGHYLMRQASMLARDAERLTDCYPRANLSALGGAANAGTSWPIDRRRSAALLGHDDIVVNSCDAGEFARDHIEEITALISILAANMGRFATDLYVWHSFEFGYVEVADALAGTSSIMPQKKNPHTLERVKSIGGQAAGWLATVMACQRPAFSTDLDFTFADDVFGRFAEVTYGSIRLMDETVGTLSVNKSRMAANSDAYWSTTSHLADELVKVYDLTFRAAHHVVSRFVRSALEAGQTPSTVTAELLKASAQETCNLAIDMTDEDLRKLLDGRNFIETRVSEGSVSPTEVIRHVATMRSHLNSIRDVVATRRSQADTAISRLLETAAHLSAA